MPSFSRCKCIVIGDAGVGKTAIIKSLITPNSFPKKYSMTAGVEISSKTIRIPNTEDVVELYVYDCSGKNIYKDLIRKIWTTNLSLVVGTFDVTREESFVSLQNTLSDLMKQIKRADSVVGVILGNKIDLGERRTISSEDAHQLAKRFKMRYYDCSAKDMISIEEPFLYLSTNWHDLNKQD